MLKTQVELRGAEIPMIKVSKKKIVEEIKARTAVVEEFTAPLTDWDLSRTIIGEHRNRLTIPAGFVGLRLVKMFLLNEYTNYRIRRNGEIVMPRWADQLT